jgi:hypothetical protein
MAQNYAQKTLDLIDERFYLEAKTEPLVNNGIRLDFSGVNTVTIYNVDVVAETNYVRSGYNRFGALVELGDGVQSFVLSQDKAFTFSVDRGNLEDSMMVTEANKAVKRQIREVSIPTVDIYRIGVADAYARAASQGGTGALTSSNAFAAVLTERTALVNALVAPEDMVILMAPAFEQALFADTTFKVTSNQAYLDNKGTNGASLIQGKVAGMTPLTLPVSYFPANFNFMIIARNVLIAPTKFNSIRLLNDVQGIDGVVAEGRRYYDCFIPTNKGVAIRAHHAA